VSLLASDPNRTRAAEPARAGTSPSLSTAVRAVLAAAVIAISAGVYAHLTSNPGGQTLMAQVDHVSDAERQQRQQAFAALGTLPLRVVEPAEVSAAVEGMGLTPQGKQALLADVAAPTPTPTQTPATQSAAAHTEPLRLAWITLWDTDVEDGDVVRIDSEGYSRTITLTKRGNTFAVPIPANGIITVTGIRDGDGGGITVGLASGPVKAIFPIMSMGQSLGLNVTIN
jgi:hypothetical protein